VARCLFLRLLTFECIHVWNSNRRICIWFYVKRPRFLRQVTLKLLQPLLTASSSSQRSLNLLPELQNNCILSRRRVWDPANHKSGLSSEAPPYCILHVERNKRRNIGGKWPVRVRRVCESPDRGAFAFLSEGVWVEIESLLKSVVFARLREIYDSRCGKSASITQDGLRRGEQIIFVLRRRSLSAF
jgi:hypothetical protein